MKEEWPRKGLLRTVKTGFYDGQDETAEGFEQNRVMF